MYVRIHIILSFCCIVIHLVDLKKNTLKAEKDVKIRFSTILCTGLPKSGKTSFCDLLMAKATESASPFSAFIKKGTSPNDTIIDMQQIDELIGKLTQYNKSQKPEPLETLDMVLLLDRNIPLPALFLLQPSVVTFITYKMRGENFILKDISNFFEFEKDYSTLVKEILSSKSVKKQDISKFSELEISNKNASCKQPYIAFVGMLKGTCTEELHEKETEIVNESLCILKKNINCSMEQFPLSFWYLEKDHYLHLVNLADHKDKDFTVIKTKLENIIAKNSTYKLSPSWILLYLKIHKLCIKNETSFLKLSEVINLWNMECITSNMECTSSETELKRALQFFHHVGALFYFDSVKDVSNFVFTDLCWLFNGLDYFYKVKDSTYRCDHGAKMVLRHEGKLLYRMVEEIELKASEPEHINLQHFVKLLEHLEYIAPLGQNAYFFPSYLESYDDGRKVFDHYGELQFDPLLITFSSGSLYRNIFCFLAAHIMQKLPKGWSKPKYDEDEQHQYTFKDLITFCVYCHYVCIIDKTFFLEIQIYSLSGDNYPAYLHNVVFKFIKQSLEDVCKKLELPDECKYGFLCCKCKRQCKQHIHLMVVKPDEEKMTYAYCSKTDKPQLLTDRHIVWFSEVKFFVICIICTYQLCNINSICKSTDRNM